MLCQRAVRTYIFGREEDRVLEPDRERAERDETRCLFKNRDFLPRSRTVKVLLLLLLLLLLRRRATVRRRGRWVPAHSRRLLLLFLSSLSSFEVEKGRERERESACSYNRENWTLNELGKFRDFFYPQKCNQRYFVIIITTDHSLRRLSLRARTTEGRPRRSGEERICA